VSKLPFTTIIHHFDRSVDRDIREIIHACLQVRDFTMVEPQDDRGNSVMDLYRYWLGRRLEDMFLLTYVPTRYRPPCLEMEVSINRALEEYSSDLYRALSPTPEFGEAAANLGFDVEILGPGDVALILVHSPTAIIRR